MWKKLHRRPALGWALAPLLVLAGCAAQRLGPPSAMASGDAMPRLINEDEPASLSLGASPTSAPQGARFLDERPAPPSPPPEPEEEPPARPQTKPVLLADPPRPAPAAPALAAPPSEPAPAGEKGARVPYASQKGQIRRKELLAFLDKSPASFLRNVESEPRFEQRRFRGWRIVAFFPGDARFNGIDLLRGDVVTRINGRSIEQPDHFFLVWQELRAARELKVDLLRDGQPHLSRWDIVE